METKEIIYYIGILTNGVIVGNLFANELIIQPIMILIGTGMIMLAYRLRI